MPAMAQDRQFSLLAFGEPLVEFVRADHAQIGPHYLMGFGGDTSNTAIAAARQGARVSYMTAIGQDQFGDELMALWAREGVDTTAIIRNPDAATGVYFVRPHASGRDFSYLRAHSAASQFSAADINHAHIAAAQILHVSSISQAISSAMRDAVMVALQSARKGATVTSYDTNLRLRLWPLETARGTIKKAMPLVDIVFPSDDEAKLLTGLDEPDAIADHYLSLGPKIVVLKRGDKGAFVATQGRRETIPAISVQAVDSTGAGDAFAGAFLAYYSETQDPFAAARRASQVAAKTVAGYGAIAPIPHRHQLEF